MKNYNYEEILEFMKFLAWKDRSNFFRDDFIKKFVEWFLENTVEDASFSRAVGMSVWRSYETKGLVYTFNEYQGDPDVCKALVFVINS